MTNDPNDADALEAAGTVAPRSPDPTTTSVEGAGTAPDVADITLPPADYNQAGVPSLDFVRDKIEGRYGRSLGSTELAQETPEARSAQEQTAKREEAAREKLAAIRRSLRGDSSS